MRIISEKTIADAVADLCRDANYKIGNDVRKALKKARQRETSPTGREILDQILKNHEIARLENLPICQDCGYAVVFLDVGSVVRCKGDIYRAVNAGVGRGYIRGYLRKSIVADPLKGENTGDNTPAIIHTTIVPGDRIRITVAPKGGGSENMSGLKMLTPGDGVEGVKKFVIDRIIQAGANPCPPVIVGVGIGGNFEYAPYLAKRALLRKIGVRNPDPYYARFERELLSAINRTGIGPMGLGGRTTALDVFIETYPRHLATLPVAVNLNCHVARHKTAVI
jgi:fumarate hydratase subunit alpha